MSLTGTGLSHSYAQGTTLESVALSGADVTVERGEIVLVLGATGSGKSTLLRVLAGLVNPSKGAVTVDGADIAEPGVRRRVGMVFQDPESQLFAESVLDDVMFAPRNAGVDPERSRMLASECLAMCGLDPEVYGSRSPFSLSGGEARRAAIAGVLAMRPDYLLMDESTAGLDASGRRSVMSLIGSLRETTGIVVVSHSSELFLSVADRVVLMSGGGIVWAGGSDRIVADPSPFFDAGLRPPPLLEAQHALAASGVEAGAYTLDPSVAAAALLEAMEGSR